MKLYNCGICGAMHPIDWSGDCRQDNTRFLFDEDAKFGIDVWDRINNGRRVMNIMEIEVLRDPSVGRNGGVRLVAVKPDSIITVEDTGENFLCLITLINGAGPYTVNAPYNQFKDWWHKELQL